MNMFQQIGTFVARIVGTLMVVVAIAGLLWYAYLAARGQLDTLETSRLAATILWLVLGSGLVLLSKLLGKLWGSGLN